MANKEKKGFSAGAYAVITAVIMAVVLVVLTIFAYTTRYNALSPEKVAQSYTDAIVQTGDGYNSYKTTLVSKNGKLKYGDFIRNAYMAAYVNDGDDVEQAEFVGKGDQKEQDAIDTVYSQMYEYYLDLMGTYSWDDYDNFFSHYFDKLVEVRHNVYGDDYMDTEFMFGALESNVQTYADSLTGTEEVLEADGKTVRTPETPGEYQNLFGKDYKITTTATDVRELSDEEAKAYIAAYKERITPFSNIGEERATSFALDGDAKEAMVAAFAGLNHADEIDAVAEVTCEIKDESGKVNVTITIPVVKIGKSWYVDNTTLDTSSLYLAK